MVRVPHIQSLEDVERHQQQVRAAAGRAAAPAPVSRRAAVEPDAEKPARRQLSDKARKSRSNLGKEWEQTLVRMHDVYEEQGVGHIDWVKNSWGYCPTKRLWDRLPPNCRAVAGDGGLLMRMKTKWDFAGHYRGVPVAFDAKTGNRETFNIAKYFKEHQCRALLKFKCGRSGAQAGFMVQSTLVGLAYWVDVDAAWDIVNQLKTENFDLDWLNQRARFIIKPDFRGLYDWGSVMFPHGGESK